MSRERKAASAWKKKGNQKAAEERQTLKQAERIKVVAFESMKLYNQEVPWPGHI